MKWEQDSYPKVMRQRGILEITVIVTGFQAQRQSFVCSFQAFLKLL